MIFKFGVGSGSPYEFQINEATVNTISRTSRYNRRGRRRSRVVTMHVIGKLKQDTTSAMTTAIEALEDGFLTDLEGATAGLYLNDGTTATAHTLDSTGSLDGIRVLRIDWDSRAGGAEYTTVRSFGLVLQAEYIQSGLGGQIQEFAETIRTVGTGGPLFVPQIRFTGQPVARQVTQFSVQYVYQTGRAVGYEGWPEGILPAPVYPLAELEHERQLEYLSPQSHLKGYFDYELRWRYVMTPIPAGVAQVPSVL